MAPPLRPKSSMRWLERALLASGASLLGTPLLLSILFRLWPALWPGATWLHDTTLVGVVQPPPVRFSWPDFWHARYQQGLEHAFDAGFPGRELLIRLHEEAWLHAFGTSGLNLGVPLTVGPGRTIYEEDDIAEYCAPHQPKYNLTNFARQLGRLQAACRQRGTAFVVLISPSKAAVYPGDIPRSWFDQRTPTPRAYDLLRPLLAAQGVATVDGQALTLAAKGSARVPMFARGAMHWNPPTVLLNGNALLAALRAQGKSVAPMEPASLRISDDPPDADADLLALLNLALPWRYPVAKMSLRRRSTPDNARLNAVLVGTSFSVRLAERLRESGQFAEVDHFFYYRQTETAYTDADVATVAAPVPPPDFEREILAADAVVLEINEAMLGDAPFARQFVGDALRHLAAGPFLAHPTFAARDGQTYAWGTELGFRAGDPEKVERRALSGFGVPEPDGTWTDGPLASVCLLAPPTAGDLVLDADVGAFADPARQLSQDVEISVNGEPIGHWQLSTMEFAHRELRIPRRLLDGIRHVVRFRVAHPVSPVELGLGNDARRLGVRFASLRLAAAPPPPAGLPPGG